MLFSKKKKYIINDVIYYGSIILMKISVFDSSFFNIKIYRSVEPTNTIKRFKF